MTDKLVNENELDKNQITLSIKENEIIQKPIQNNDQVLIELKDNKQN